MLTLDPGGTRSSQQMLSGRLLCEAGAKGQKMAEGDPSLTALGRKKGMADSFSLLGAPGLTSSNKKLLETSASLVATGALLVVTRSY